VQLNIQISQTLWIMAMDLKRSGTVDFVPLLLQFIPECNSGEWLKSVAI